MGMKHCGKTTLGRLLSRRVALPFEDLDEWVCRIYLDRTGKVLPLRELFRTLGKTLIQELEVEGIKHLSETYGVGPLKPSCILALGGGTIENSKALSRFDPFGYYIYLEEKEEILLDRILQGGIPSFLSEQDPGGDFHRLYEFRTALYRAKADRTLTATGKTVEDVLEELLHHIHVGVLDERK